ncbi:MAG: hypothetical protein WA831_00735 [Methylovirgula sp.]
MTSIACPTSAQRGGEVRRLPVWLLIAAALVLGFFLSFANAHKVWQNGTFFDSDDAMQLVQVRELLAGQNWFDMTIGRLDPPHGVFMHWSRTVDAPLALLIKTFGLLLPMQTAERLTRLVFPLILQALLYLGVARLARVLIGPRAVLAAITLVLLSGMEFGEFQPGRIDHTAPQIVLLLFMLASLVEAIDPAYARRAAGGGVLAAVSLSISIENLPFIVAFAALFVALWVARGALMKRALASFGVGLGLALPVAFVATVGKAHWFDMACDAYSAAYLVPGLAVAAATIALAAWRLQTNLARLAAAGLVAGAVVAVAILTKPICFLDPYTGIDPLVRQIWLKNVEEAMPLSRFFHNEPAAAAIYALPIALGFIATLVAAYCERGLTRLRWLLVAAISALSVALSCWMIRVIGFASPIALLGGTWCIIRLHDVLARTRWRAAAMLAFVLVLPFSSIGWALVMTRDPEAATRADRAACLASAAFAPLAGLPPGVVLAPIDAGSHLLALTPHSVLAAPYHRDNHGNRAALDAFLSDPQTARQILRANRVTYVMTCSGLNETAALAARAPHGLAAALIRGTPPDWLRALPRNGKYQVFVMRP